MKSCLAILILLIAVISCTNKKETMPELQTIDLGQILQNPKNEKIFEGVRYVKLESNPDIMLGDGLYFEQKDEKLYILDRANQKSLLIFNNKGEFINKVGKPGKGPEEYVQAVDFFVRNDTVDILSNAGPVSTIYSYKENGDFIRKKELNYLALSFEFVHNQYYAVNTSFNKMLHDHRIYLLDREGSEIKKLLPNNTEINMPLGEQSFSIFENDVYYFEPFNDTVYHFDNSELNPIYVLDFGKYNVPADFYQMELMKGFEMLSKQGFSLIKNVFANEENVVFEVTRQQEGVPLKLFVVHYNKKTKELKYLTLSEEDYIFRFPIGLNDKNEMMYLVFPVGDVNKDVAKFGLDLNVQDFSESDNPIVMFCKL